MCQYVIQLVILCVCWRGASSIRCYQCSSLEHRGCWRYNLNTSYLRECPAGGAGGGNTPVCRTLSQVQYFIESQEVTLIRQCAYLYELPLECRQSRFSGLHYSLACECGGDGCNAARSARGAGGHLLASTLSALLLYCDARSA